MKKRPLIFSVCLILLAFICCTFAYPIVNNLTVYTYTQKMNLLSQIELPLEALTIEQARIVDPNYSWISYEEQDLSPEIENAIRERALSSQTSLNTSLASDTNLAWSLKYKGQTVNHYWSDDYDHEQGTLDITFTSNDEKVTFTNNGMDMVEGTFIMFNKDNRVALNPALVPEDRQSSEYVYYLVLPEDFSIRFYIPEKLHSNGGEIARIASEMDWRSTAFCLSAGALLIAFYVLMWNKEIESEAFLFRKFIRLKAGPAWIVLIVLCGGMTLVASMMSQFMASGELRELLYSLGMRFTQLNWFLPVFWYAVWTVTYLVYGLAFLYIKYIFAFGFMRYLREDTLTSMFLARSQNRAVSSARDSLETWTWARLVPLCAGFCLFIMCSMGIGWALSGWFGAFLVLLIDMVLVMFLVRRMYVVVHEDYLTTLAAANELVEGNFSEIHPSQAGAFQKLYDSLIRVKDGFQTALKDGLASQNMKTQLISNVSHDLKTPVTGIKSYAELIGMASSLDQVQEYSKRLINYTDRLNALITDLFDVARANSGDIQLNPMPLNLSELILQVQGEWSDTFGKADLQAVLELPEKAVSSLDADKTMRIIDNLMGNIAKYAMPRTRVFITLQEIPGEYVLVCKNISKTPLDFKPDEITERFVRGDKSRHEPGSGLGLAIVKSFMEVQGGNFNIEIDGDVFKAILMFPKMEGPATKAPLAPAPDSSGTGGAPDIPAADRSESKSMTPFPETSGLQTPQNTPAALPKSADPIFQATSAQAGNQIQKKSQ